MQIENRDIESITPYSKNAKKHSEKQIEQVAESINAFGWAQPIVIDKQGVVIAGHGRLEAAKLLELEEVPTLTVDLTESQAKAYRLADNKLNESDWNIDLVIEELKELDIAGIDIELTGFDSKIMDLDFNLKNKELKPETEDVSFTAEKKKCPNCGYDI